MLAGENRQLVPARALSQVIDQRQVRGRRSCGLRLVLAACAVLPVSAAGPAGTSYTGTFASDDDQRVFPFTLSQSGQVTIRTWSYAGGVNAAGAAIPPGGFDPTISLYDANGNLIVYNRNGGCGSVAADPTTSFCWDSFLNPTLPAGSYSVVLTQSENLPNGPGFAQSFAYAGQANFTTPPGVDSPGFWDLFPSKRTSAYALDISGASSVGTNITSSAQLPAGTVGQPYAPVFTFTATSSTSAPLTWSVIAGSLPPGMALNSSTGVLHGIPQQAGTFAFTIQVTDGVQPATQRVSITIDSPASQLFITTSSLPSGTVGKPYGPVSLSAGGGSSSYTWSVTGLPSNLSATPAGSISGTPATSGLFTLQISVSDTVTGLTANTSLNLAIKPAPLIISSSGGLGGFVPGAAISGAFTATGGQPPYIWTASGLPGGLSLSSSTGAFSGIAGNPGVYSFTVQVSDSESPAVAATLKATYSVLGITTKTLPFGTETAAYSATLAAIGGTPPYSFSATGLPQGLSLSTSGAISGTPKAAGNFPITVQVTDSTGLSTSSPFVLAIVSGQIIGGGPLSLTILSGSLPSGGVAVLFSSSLQASGGTPPYSWSVLGGVLPGGISVSSSGSVQGTPAAPGNYSFIAQATDATGATAADVFTLTINPAPLDFSPGPFPIGIAGSDYPAQILSAGGGLAPYSFTISAGSLPPGLSLSGPQISGVATTSGTFTFTIAVSDSGGEILSATASITISPAHPDLILSQAAVSFSVAAGANGVPAPASVTVRSSVVQQILNYTVGVSPAAPWLDVVSGVTTPGAIALGVDPSASSLPASVTPYTTAISITCIAPSPCAGSVQTIHVTLTVSAPPPQLSAAGSLLSFNAPSSNPLPSSQSLGLRNNGGGTIAITSITAADPWLSISGAPSTLPAGMPQSLTVTANPAGLSPGYLRSTITVNSSAGSATVPVTLLVGANPAITLAPSGSQFSASAGSSPGKSGGSFNVISTSGTANFTASVLPGANWLTLTSPGGTTPITYSLNAAVVASLAPAAYYGTIQVVSPDVTDSPQTFQVVLNITPAGAPVTPDLSTAGLIFISSAAAGTTPAQTVAVYSSSNAPAAYQASAATIDGAAWLAVSPATGTASANAAGPSSISVNPAGLAPGVYSGGVSYAFASDGVRTVNVTLLIKEAGAACTPTRVIATQTGLPNNFTQLAGWPAPLAIQLIDDCGSAVPGAQITATFSNGDPPLTLTPLNSTSGTYLGTWTPQNVSSQVTVTAATAHVTGEVRANNAPALTPNGTVSAFNALAGAALAPGEIVAIYGTNLAGQTSTAAAVPLPASLSGTSVLIGGVPVPLYYVSPTQINAEVPIDLIPGNQYEIQVSVNGALTAPGSIQIVSAAPGIAAAASGEIIAQHAADYSLISDTSPAQPGEFIVLYLVGLGATDNASPLSHPLVAPILTLNGGQVPVYFAGLTPGEVGLYQIDVQIPADAPNGDLTLSVSQAGASSNLAILPVHQ
jgi:uncharacterized protein (TIGR03437 family)